MSQMGQNRKYSLRADDVRSTLESGLKSGIAPSPVCANNGSPSFDHLVATGDLAAMVIRAARLAAMLLHIARGLRPAAKGPAHL
jgi:hypothetical protein